ncbi:MAG TPA: hypothetical protein VLT83_03765 [Opitutaceae bacterium]|nr:hypothetical protein [Opitutaceae bacterium]
MNRPPRRAPFLAMLPAILLGALLAVPATRSSHAAEEPPEREAGDDSQGSVDQFDLLRFNNTSASHYYYSLPPGSEPLIYFFPPVPPPLGADYPVLGRPAPRAPAPPELAAYVDEWFYPFLGVRLLAGDLTKELRAELEAYRAAKIALQNELRAGLAGLKGVDPAGREQELGTLAREQAPRIVALEAVAERIRGELRLAWLAETRAGDGASADKAGWHLPAERRAPATPGELQLEAEAMHGIAFFGEGLSAGQRRLLLAAAIELRAAANAPPGTRSAPQEGWLLYFSPEPARIRLAANLSAALARRLSEYAVAKQGLITELCDTLRRGSAIDAVGRLEALKRLAADQAPRLAALEGQAEEIRRELVAMPNAPGPPAQFPLPPEIMARIAVYRGHKLAVLKTLHALLADPSRTTERNPTPGKVEEGGEPPAPARETASPVVRPAKPRVSVEEFNRRQSALLGELNAERAAIREALSEYGRATNRPTDQKSIDDLLKDFESARQEQEIWDKYRDYQAAVLLPGLSPEQRRLLFGSAVEQLALPLPAGIQMR